MDTIKINETDHIFRATITWFEEVLSQGVFIFPEKKKDGNYRTRAVLGHIHNAKYFLPYIGKDPEPELTGKGWLPPTVPIHSIKGTVSVGFKIFKIETQLTPKQMIQKLGNIYPFERHDSWTAIDLEIPGFVLDRSFVPRARLVYTVQTYEEFQNACFLP